MPEHDSTGFLRRHTVLVKAVALGVLLSVLLLLFSPVCVQTYIQTKGRHTQALLYRVAFGLDAYREDFGGHPPDFVPPGAQLAGYAKDARPTLLRTPAHPPEALHYYLGNPRLFPHAEYMQFRPEVDATDLNGNGLPEVVDAWGRPILYNRAPFASGRFDFGPRPFHNTETFDLYSVGSDGHTGSTVLPDPSKDLAGYCAGAMDEPADGDGDDDINNW